MMSHESAKRQRSRRGEGEHLREEILRAGEALLLERGTEDAVSIRAVASSVGVTPPSIYLHFPDKEDLLIAICEQQFAGFTQALAAAAAAATDPLDEIRLRGLAYIEYGLTHPESYRVMFMTQRTSSSPAREQRVMNCLCLDQQVAAVARAMESGHIRAGDPLMVATGLWASVHGVTSLLIAHPDFPWPERNTVIDHVVTMAIAGLISDDAPSVPNQGLDHEA